MTTPTKFNSVTPSFYPHSRVALALSRAAIDAQTHLKVPSFAAFASADVAATDYVQKILDGSKNWKGLIDHSYPKSLADGSAELNGFRHYSIQDATYLEYYCRVRMQSVGKTGTFDQLSDFVNEFSGDVQYVKDARKNCTTKLGVPSDVVTEEKESDPIKNSVKYYESVGDWLDLHIALLPCIFVSDSTARSEIIPKVFKGYYTIAEKLFRSPDTVKNTVYYKLWVEPNSDASYAINYKDFVNNAIDDTTWKAKGDGWISKFDTACTNEIAILELGRKGYGPYVVTSDGKNRVQDGTYTIRSYRTDDYLTRTANNTVTLNKDPSDNGKWVFTNGEEGFMISDTVINSNSNFLSVDISGKKPPFKVTVSKDKKSWAINTIDVFNRSTYQLLADGGLQFVLNWPAGEVNVEDNDESSNQIWLIELFT